MPEIDVVQYGAPVLTEARPFDLPGEREAAERCVDQIHATMERIGQVPPPSPRAWELAAPRRPSARWLSRTFTGATPLAAPGTS